MIDDYHNCQQFRLLLNVLKQIASLSLPDRSAESDLQPGHLLNNPRSPAEFRVVQPTGTPAENPQALGSLIPYNWV